MEGTIVTKETVSASALDIFPGIETASILTPASGESKFTGILNNDGDLSFLDKGTVITEPANETPEQKAEREKKAPVDQTEADKILNFVGGPESEEEADETGITANQGRPKTEKNALISYLQNKIESKEFSAFEDWDEKKEDLPTYLSKQPEKVLHQMLDENWKAKEAEILERTPQEFFESLPEKLQYAARYVMEGGTDMEKLFGALARVEQVGKLDVTTEEGQIQTTRAYLQATGFGGGKPEVIEEQIAEWKEEGKLEKKAKTFKPDLDEMQKEQVEYQIQQQSEWNKQRAAAARVYQSNLQKALEKGEVNGLKVDKKVVAELYNGLLVPDKQSVSGGFTNLLGAKLDEIQFVKPNFNLLTEVTYHLMDPEGFYKAIGQKYKNAATEEIARKLKSEMQDGTNTSGGGPLISNNEVSKTANKKLPKPNILARESWQ